MNRAVDGRKFLVTLSPSTRDNPSGPGLRIVVERNRRSATYALYETIIRLYLVPGLGAKSLVRLSVPAVQMFLNQRIEAGDSIRKVQVMRSVL